MYAFALCILPCPETFAQALGSFLPAAQAQFITQCNRTFVERMGYSRSLQFILRNILHRNTQAETVKQAWRACFTNQLPPVTEVIASCVQMVVRAFLWRSFWHRAVRHTPDLTRSALNLHHRTPPMQSSLQTVLFVLSSNSIDPALTTFPRRPTFAYDGNR